MVNAPEDPLLMFLSEEHYLRFIPFGGNGGDRLLQFCEQRLIDWSPASTGHSGFDYLCYHGGGYFGFYPDYEILQSIEPGPEPLVFFPRACLWRDNEHLTAHAKELERIGRDVIAFARDPVSADHFDALSEFVSIEVRLSHDATVLYSTVFDADKPMLLTTFREPCESLTAVYRREDEESAGWPQFRIEGPDAIYVDPAMMGFLSPEHTATRIGQAAYLAYWSWCYKPRVVITDRLHVALARWLFELDTILFPGMGHKIGEVWGHSMASDPRGCRFARTPEEIVEFARELGVEVRVG